MFSENRTMIRFKIGDIVTYSDLFYSKDKSDIYGVVVGFTKYSSVTTIKVKWIKNKAFKFGISTNNNSNYYSGDIIKIG